MADAKLSALTLRADTDIDPWLDRLYFYLAAGATDADKQLAATPLGLLIGARKRLVHYWNDYISLNDIVYAASGTGSEVRLYQSYMSAVGVARLQTGTTTTGYAHLSYGDPSSQAFSPALAHFHMMSILYTDETNMSDGTNRYGVITGLTSDLSTYNPSNGILVRVKDDVNGGKFQLVCRSGGSESAADLGVTPSIATKYNIEIEIDYNGGSGNGVRARIDGGSWSSWITTDIPTGTLFYVPAGIIKTAGTTSRFVFADAAGFVGRLYTAR